MPILSLDETKAALDAEVPECSAVFDATKVELDKVALAAAAAADSGKVDCLIDAFAQPGFCELVTRVYCSVHVSSSLPYTHAHTFEAMQCMKVASIAWACTGTIVPAFNSPLPAACGRKDVRLTVH